MKASEERKKGACDEWEEKHCGELVRRKAMAGSERERRCWSLMMWEMAAPLGTGRGADGGTGAYAPICGERLKLSSLRVTDR